MFYEKKYTFFQAPGGDLPGWALKEAGSKNVGGVGQGAAWCKLSVLKSMKFALGVTQRFM